MLGDIVLAARRLRQQPLFALVAISILALGIGANAATDRALPNLEDGGGVRN